jgi:hypothetical protein
MKIQSMALLALLAMTFCSACAKQTAPRDVKGNANEAFQHLDREKESYGK